MIKITYMILGIISLITVVGTTSISSHAFAQITPANSTSTSLQDQVQSLQTQAQSLQKEVQSLTSQLTSQLNGQSIQSGVQTPQPSSIFGQ